MLGITVILGLSWAALHYTVGQNLRILGFSPFPKRVRQFFSGLFIAGLLCLLTQLLEARLAGYRWVLNGGTSANTILQAIWWDFKSVLTEELVFRGALLFLLIQKTSTRWGIVLSSIVFGVYHWFSMGLFGDIVPMVITFIGTGLMGLVWANALTKTSSIFLPLGMHLGWNITFNTLFSKGPLGTMILVPSSAPQMDDWASLVNLTAWVLVVPLLLYLYTRYLVSKEVQA